MPFMVAQLEGVATQRGVRVETLQPQPTLTHRKVMQFPMRIGLQADLPTLTLLLEDLQEASPVLEVDRLTVRNGQEQGGKLQVDMTLSSFVVLDPKAPVAKRRLIRAVNYTSEDSQKPSANAAMAHTAKAPASSPPPLVGKSAAPVPPQSGETHAVTATAEIKDAQATRAARRRARMQSETPGDPAAPRKVRNKPRAERANAPVKRKRSNGSTMESPPTAPASVPTQGVAAPAPPVGTTDAIPQKVPNGGAR